ncbi:hypothetical protein [Oleispirillum naphthae]|uniref:hypothetical protein n=1 Tax=Oleispirillum naphthae TaxID=2838853 RepID=UPI0030825C9D
MLFTLIVAACVAFAAAGAALLAFRLLGRRAPPAVLLAAAGLGLFAYTQWERYTWAERTAAALPPQMTVALRLPETSTLEFWTHLWPRTGSLVVADRAATLSNPEAPGVYVARTLLLARNAEVIEMRQFVDCAGRRRAPATRPEGGLLPPPEAWTGGGEPAALFAAVCPPAQK